MTHTAAQSSQQTIALFQQYVIGNYTRYPVCLVRGEGSWVWDAEGNRYTSELRIIALDPRP